MKHTPGPWRLEGPDMFGDFNILHQANTLAVGAIVSNLREPEEVASNACLVAAAPDLYAALSDMVRLFDGYQGIEWKNAKAAIAKAEGRSPAKKGGA